MLKRIQSQHDSSFRVDDSDTLQELIYGNLVDVFLWAIAEAEILGNALEVQQRIGNASSESSGVSLVFLQDEVL